MKFERMIISFFDKARTKKFSAVLIIFLIIFSGCASYDKSEEVVFLENVMIREDGIYVLMGSKPMSSFPIEDGGFPETEDETKTSYELYLSEIQAGNLKETPVCYEEFAEGCQSLVHLHHRKLWNLVQDRLKEYVGPRYRFVVRKNPFGLRRRAGLFINVPNAILTLKRYYDEFERLYGRPFEPEHIVDEIADEESDFWTKVFSSNYFQGVLFGYGCQNSNEFDWRMKNALYSPRLEIEGQELEPLIKKEINIRDLRLPNISVYSFADRKLEKYRRERERIVKELEGKDFEQTVKKWLSEGAD